MNTWIKSIGLFYVNIFFIISMSACQTLRNSEDQSNKEADILNDQKTLVVSFLNKGLPQMAHKELRPLLHQYPQDADFKNLMGLTLLALENPKHAVPFFQQSLKIQARASVALNLSSAYIEAKEYDRAIRLLQNMSKSPSMKEYRYPERIAHNIALAAERKNDWRTAEKYYVKALADNPQYYLSLMRLGQLYEKTERPKMAIQRFLTARAACNLCFDPVNGLVMNYLAMKAPSRAVDTIRVFLQQKALSETDRERAIKLLSMTEGIAANLPSSNNARTRRKNTEKVPVAGSDISQRQRNKTSQKKL
ncbi:MAG: tetratricopeptide repeat protein [Oligoflexus sp.]